MAGVKGRSGGPRKNAGGARPGAGRKPREPAQTSAQALKTRDPEAWLTALMLDESMDVRDRKDAAKALLVHRAKMVEQAGKKELAKGAAGKAAGGKFAASAPPKLALVK